MKLRRTIRDKREEKYTFNKKNKKRKRTTTALKIRKLIKQSDSYI